MGIWAVLSVVFVIFIVFSVWDERFGITKYKREIWDFISEERTAERNKQMAEIKNRQV